MLTRDELRAIKTQYELVKVEVPRNYPCGICALISPGVVLGAPVTASVVRDGVRYQMPGVPSPKQDGSHTHLGVTQLSEEVVRQHIESLRNDLDELRTQYPQLSERLDHHQTRLSMVAVDNLTPRAAEILQNAADASLRTQQDIAEQV